jgi:hypothetical protein
VDIETALHTQRFRLLRLLAGLVFALKVVSFMPAASMMPRSVRRSFSAIILRAEAAAQCLVVVCARLLFGRSAVEAAIGRAPIPRPFEILPDDGFSNAVLLRRIAVLQTVLRDLPRYARRLMKRCSRARKAPSPYGMPTIGTFPARLMARDARIDRPPDIACHPTKALPSGLDGRVLACLAFEACCKVEYGQL